MTLPADAVLRERHLKSAVDHVLQAISYTEGLVGRDGADVDQLYHERSELRHVVGILNDIIGDIVDNITAADADEGVCDDCIGRGEVLVTTGRWNCHAPCPECRPDAFDEFDMDCDHRIIGPAPERPF